MDTAMEVVEQDSDRALITIKQEDALTVYTQPDGLKPYLALIENAVSGFVGDVSTAKGRDAIRAMAHKVVRSKTYLEEVGKKLADEQKSVPKKIDASRQLAKKTLEQLAAQVRQPLTDWEAEQARIKAEQEAKAAAEKLAAQVEHDHEVALLMNAEHDRKAAEAKARAEAKAIERERRAREEGERQAREEAERKVIDARLAAERAEREKAEAQERAARAEQAQAESEKRAAEQAEQARLKAIDDERAAVARQKEQEEAAARARQESHEHRRTINREALAALVAVGLSDELGKAVIMAIAGGQVPHVSIAY